MHFDNYNLHCVISIHALLAESDGIGLVFMWWGVRFLSTLSLRRATIFNDILRHLFNNFYPRSPCGERQNARPDIRQPYAISIHALLAESDTPTSATAATRTISIHALLAESDTFGSRYDRHAGISIHALLAESDLGNVVAGLRMLNFYPRSPCGERQISPHSKTIPSNFYPRSPCGERPPCS